MTAPVFSTGSGRYDGAHYRSTRDQIEAPGRSARMQKTSYRADKALVIGGLAGVIACAWAYLVPASLDMYGRMDGAAAWTMQATWDARYLLLVFLMWSVMMVAMMLPGALPTILIFQRAIRNDAQVRSPARSMFAFASGYVLAWV